MLEPTLHYYMVEDEHVVFAPEPEVHGFVSEECMEHPCAIASQHRTISATDTIGHDDHHQRLEVITLKRDIGNLLAVVERMTTTHHNEMSNLRSKLQDSADHFSRGMSTLTEQMAHQSGVVARACRVTPTDAPG
jgi:hypothetical protein